METNVNLSEDAEIVALQALGWVLQDEKRAQRLLSLTGLDPRELRSGLEDPALLTALLGFLAGHEPDLVSCAEALDIAPEKLASAAQQLGNPGTSS